MKQLTQKLKDGITEIIEVPDPTVGKGMLLVRNAYSAISAGTEGGKVKAARKSLIGKAQERPQQARQMIDLLKQSGPTQAYRTLMRRRKKRSAGGPHEQCRAPTGRSAQEFRRHADHSRREPRCGAG